MRFLALVVLLPPAYLFVGLEAVWGLVGLLVGYEVIAWIVRRRRPVVIPPTGYAGRNPNAKR